jgi:hypothetical protein
MSDRGDHFRANADEVRKQAERSINPLDKERWLRIAEDWLKLAQSEDGRPRLGNVALHGPSDSSASASRASLMKCLGCAGSSDFSGVLGDIGSVTPFKASFRSNSVSA